MKLNIDGLQIPGTNLSLLLSVKFVTSYREEEIIQTVRDILKHVLDPSSDLQG